MSVLEVMVLTECVKAKEFINNVDDSDYSKQTKLENSIHKPYKNGFNISKKLNTFLNYLGKYEIVDI